MKKVGRPKGRTFEIKLTQNQRKEFIARQRKGRDSARILSRIRIVLLADQGLSDKQIAKREHVCPQTAYNTLKRFVTMGNIEDKPRSGRPEKVSGKVKAHIVATACTDAPKGRARWTVRLLADQVVQFELLDSLSKSTVANILKKTN